jgi:hypothetical protein
MEVQDTILKKIKKDTNDILKSQIFPSISELIELKMKEETDKFFEKTNILGDSFNKPIETYGFFSFCGNCDLCKGVHHMSEGHNPPSKACDEWKKECINSVNTCKEIDSSTESRKLYEDEYILLCSRRVIRDGGHGYSCYYYTNYGRVCAYRGGHVEQKIRIETRDRGGTNPSMYSNGSNYVISEYFDEKILLTSEFINILNKIDFILRQYGQNGGAFNYKLFNQLMHIYRKFNPKASDLYRIEKKKEEIKTMIKDLQQRETKIVQDNQLLSVKQKEFTNEKDKLKKEKEEFEQEKQIHKQKSKNLLKRENSLFIKESVKSVHHELNDISYSLSDIVDLLGDIDPIIEKRLNQNIEKLSNMFSDQSIIVEAQHVKAST